MFAFLVCLAPPAELSERGMGIPVAFYADLKIMLPLMVALGALLLAAVAIGARWRNSECRRLRGPGPAPPARPRPRLMARAHCRLLLLQGMRPTGCSGR